MWLTDALRSCSRCLNQRLICYRPANSSSQKLSASKAPLLLLFCVFISGLKGSCWKAQLLALIPDSRFVFVPRHKFVSVFLLARVSSVHHLLVADLNSISPSQVALIRRACSLIFPLPIYFFSPPRVESCQTPVLHGFKGEEKVTGSPALKERKWKPVPPTAIHHRNSAQEGSDAHIQERRSSWGGGGRGSAWRQQLNENPGG